MIIGFSRAPSYTQLSSDHAVLADNTANGATANYDNTMLAFSGANVFDTDNFHNTVTNNSRLTIPSAVNGRYVVVYASIYQEDMVGGASSYAFAIAKNGSVDFVGTGAACQATAEATYAFCSIHTQPIQVSTGDFFEVQCRVSDTTTTPEATFTGFGLLVVG